MESFRLLRYFRIPPIGAKIVAPPFGAYMAVRLGGVTRQAMSWSFVLVSLFVPARHAAAQRVAGIIDAVMRVLHGAPASNK